MVRVLLCNISPSLSPPRPSSPSPTPKPKPNSSGCSLRDLTVSLKTKYSQEIPSIAQALSSTLLSVALSLGLFYASPPDVISSELITPQEELECREEEDYVDDRSTARVVTNEEIVEEAWQIVNDSFIDTGRHRWSPDSWLV